MDSIQQQLSDILTSILDVEEVDPREELTSLGITSIDLMRLAARLEKNFGFRPQVNEFMKLTSIEKLAEFYQSHIDTVESINAQALNCAEASRIEFAFNRDDPNDIRQDIRLHEAIKPAAATHSVTGSPTNLFVTGATGFLGAHVLHSLLQETQATISCLVRAENSDQGMKRILKNLEYYKLWDDSYSERVKPVVGDISQPLLGLSVKDFHRVASEAQALYHIGAVVNFVHSYDMLKETNVDGTIEMLRLACADKQAPLYYVSTYGVFNSPEYLKYKIIDESTSTDHWELLANGYEQSKWVSEKILAIAKERGIPVTIFRPGTIAGDSRNGIFNSKNDILSLMIRGSLQMKLVPKIDMDVDLTPVDYISKALTVISLQPDVEGKTYHLVNPQSVSYGDFVKWIRNYGYDFEETSYQEWRQALLKVDRSNALFPLLSLFEAMETSDRFSIPYMRSDETLRALKDSKLTCPAPENRLLQTYFSRFIKEGFLDVPERREIH